TASWPAGTDTERRLDLLKLDGISASSPEQPEPTRFPTAPGGPAVSRAGGPDRGCAELFARES
ncbi:MAG TPA: hypothetical protein VIC82_01730, partial [Candidatus Nanopelagicales bacterium]